jgi:hypothetical protein
VHLSFSIGTEEWGSATPSGEAESFPLVKKRLRGPLNQWGSGILSACEKTTPWTAKEWRSGILSACQKKSSAGLIPIATKRTSRFAAIIQRSTEPFFI